VYVKNNTNLGRVQHKKFGNSFVEMGANWVSFIKIKIIKSLTFLFLHKIYGKGENPIYKMAIRHGLKTVPNEKENLAFFGDNCIIDKSVGNQVYFEFEDLKLKLLEYAGIFLLFVFNCFT
jgi:polyamine oxidase